MRGPQFAANVDGHSRRSVGRAAEDRSPAGLWGSVWQRSGTADSSTHCVKATRRLRRCLAQAAPRGAIADGWRGTDVTRSNLCERPERRPAGSGERQRDRGRPGPGPRSRRRHCGLRHGQRLVVVEQWRRGRHPQGDYRGGPGGLYRAHAAAAFPDHGHPRLPLVHCPGQVRATLTPALSRWERGRHGSAGLRPAVRRTCGAKPSREGTAQRRGRAWGASPSRGGCGAARASPSTGRHGSAARRARA